MSHATTIPFWCTLMAMLPSREASLFAPPWSLAEKTWITLPSESDRSTIISSSPQARASFPSDRNSANHTLPSCTPTSRTRLLVAESQSLNPLVRASAHE
jgi:hypothetical protein